MSAASPVPVGALSQTRCGVELDNGQACAPNGKMTLTRPIKTAERTARRIVQDIADGGYTPGDVLQSELEMLKHYDISRGTLREALRLLETQGLVFMRSGPSGGPVVGAPDAFYLGRMATLYFRLAGATYNDITDALLVIEPMIARLAAQQKHPKAAEELMAALAVESCELTATSSPPQNAVLKLQGFHAVLSRLCGNQVLALIADAIGSIVSEHIVVASNAAPIISHSHDDHVRLAEAVIKGDADEAARLAYDHLKMLMDFHRSQVPGIFAQPVQWR